MSEVESYEENGRKPDFQVFLNRKKQWVNVYLWDVHPNTFEKWQGGRWGYFIAKWDDPKKGWFGDVHFVKSRVRNDVVTHEFAHVWIEWILSNRIGLSVSNEERLVSMLDNMVGQFDRKMRKVK